MTTIVYENTFIFNELNYFKELLNGEKDMSEQQKENTLNELNLSNTDFKFVYQKDNKGSWFMKCYKGSEQVSWDTIENWMRQIVWDFEKENKMYFN